MRLKDIIHETWDIVGSSLTALVDAANIELRWASEVSGCSLKETLPTSELHETLSTQDISTSVEPTVVVSNSHVRKQTEDSTGHDFKRQRSDKSPTGGTNISLEEAIKLSTEATSISSNSLGGAANELDKEDKKQVKVVLKGRTRHKAKELLNRVEKGAEARTEVVKLTSPTTKVVNLASKADESRLNSDKRLQSTVSSSLDILRKGLMMKKANPADLTESIIVDTNKRIIDSTGNSLSSINTSFARSSNTEIPVVDTESKVSVLILNLNQQEISIPRESTAAIDRLSKIRPINQLKSLALESASLDKDRKLVLGGHSKIPQKPEQLTDKENKAIGSFSSESKISHIPTVKTLAISKTPLETAPKIQNMILDALEKPANEIKSNAAHSKSCILDDNGNLPEIQSDDSDADQKLSPPKVANWAHTPHLRGTLETQKLKDPDAIFGNIPPIQLEEVFKNIPAKKFSRPRASSGVWSSLTPDEIATYKSRMGFDGKE